MFRRARSFVSALFIVTMLTGCKLEREASAIASIDTATQTATASIGQFDLLLNDAMSEIYWDELQVHPDLNALPTEAGIVAKPPGPSSPASDTNASKPSDPQIIVDIDPSATIEQVRSPLYSRYTADQIKAELGGLNVLAAYTKVLNSLANSDAPAQTIKSMDALVATATKLDTDLKKLSPKSKSSASIAGPVTQIAAILAKWALYGYQAHAVRKSIEECREPVSRLIASLRLFTTAAESVMRTRVNNLLTNFVALYNDKYSDATSPSQLPARPGSDLLTLNKKGDLDKVLTAATLKDRKDLQASIQRLQLLHERLEAIHASRLFPAMQKVNDDLYQYTESGLMGKKDPWSAMDKDLGDYITETNYFKQQIDRFGVLIKP